MGKIKFIKPFVNLSGIGLSEKSLPFSLDTLYLEKEMNDKLGIDISNINSIDNKIPLLEIIAKRFNECLFNDNLHIKGTLKKYNSLNVASSMIVEDNKELEAHMLFAYQVLYAHYILREKSRSDGSLEKNVYGIARQTTLTQSVMSSLMEFGYPTTYVRDNQWDYKLGDHEYLLLPFVINDSQTKGTIILDPNYDRVIDYDLAEVKECLGSLIEGKKHDWDMMLDLTRKHQDNPRIQIQAMSGNDIDYTYRNRKTEVGCIRYDLKIFNGKELLTYGCGTDISTVLDHAHSQPIEVRNSHLRIE